MAQPGQQHRWWDGRWDGWYQRPSGLWQHRGYEWRGHGWSRGGAPWYTREAVYDWNAKREDVEWKATQDEWGRAAGDENGSDGDRFGLFDHALPSQKEVIADAEEEGDRGTGFAHVSLVGALAGERYCFPGVGNPPDFLVPVQRYQAQDIMNSYLVRLLRIQEGWAIHRNAETREPTLSPSPVTAFIGKDDRPYQYGCLAKIAKKEGMVFVMFGDTPLPVSFEDKGCRDLDDVDTPRSDTDRFALV